MDNKWKNLWTERDVKIAAWLVGDQVRARRAAWRPVADQVIRPTLDQFKASLSQTAASQQLGVYVKETRAFENLSSIQFWFGNRPTGVSYQNETMATDGARMREFSLGVERGAALVFSQGETGQVMALAYSFATELPGKDRPGSTDDPSRSDPWVGPVWEPEALTSNEVADVCTDFLSFAPTTSIMWNGPTVLPRRFRRPRFLRESALHDSVEELVRAARLNAQIVGTGIPQLLTDMGRVLEEVDERFEKAFLEKIKPLSPRARRVLSKISEKATWGLLDGLWDR